jgi:PAS domain S-box-containing protein
MKKHLETLSAPGRQITHSAASNSELLLERAAAAGQAGAWQWDITENQISWTSTLTKLLDLDSVDFDGTPDTLSALIHADDREQFRRGLDELLRAGETYDTEVRALRPTDEAQWLHVNIAVVREGDRCIRMSGSAVNIDARKRAESALRESEQRFATLFHSSPLNITLSSVATGQLRDVNDAFITVTGFTRDEALGRTAVELGIWPSAEDRAAVMAAVHEGGSVRNRIVHLRARGGEERVGSFTAEHVLVDGEPHILTLFEDITLRERTQAALRESEQRLRLALRAASAGVWQMDTLTGEIRWSDEFRELYGYDESTSPGRDTWAAHLHPEDRERMLNDLRTRLKPGTNEYRHEFRILHPTRGLRWILALGQIERNEQGRALTVTGISIDITRIKEVEQELRETDGRKNEFLAVLSHELRNPLAPLRNGIEILRLTHGNGEIAERARVMMARQLEQMVHLIDDLLEVSRISRGKIELKREPVDLTIAIQHALEVSKPLIDSAGHSLTVDMDPGSLITRLAQVFGNLLNNAAKYTNPGGQLRLAVAQGGDHVRVSIRDNGIGIPVEMLPKVFEMFAQLDNSLQRTQGGLGIGLSLAKRLVEMHDGTLEARSEGLGKGCEFIVELPLYAPVVSERREAPPSAKAPSPPNALRVLVADDNADAATSLAIVLGMRGHQVRTARDGVETLQIAQSFEPDVAILDIGMPRLDGYEVCRQLRVQPGGRDMLIIALTGWGQSEDKLRSQDAGFDEHFVKPADVGALEKLLEERATRSSSSSAN